MSELNFDAVIERLKRVIQAKTSSAVAEALGMSSSAFANRKRDGSIPLEEISKLALARDLSIDWILLGKKAGAIDMGVFREIQSALRSDRSAIPPDERDAYAAEIYNHVWPIADDEEKRREMISGLVAIASTERLKANIRLYDAFLKRAPELPQQLTTIPEFGGPEEIKKLRDEDARELERIEALLGSTTQGNERLQQELVRPAYATEKQTAATRLDDVVSRKTAHKVSKRKR